MYTGLIRQILNPKHRTRAYRKGIYLNIFQASYDRQIGAVARRMKKAGLIQDTFPSLSGLTVVVPFGKHKKIPINNLKELEPFATAKGRNISDFQISAGDIVEFTDLD